ncbi:MAG: hypothetical protein IPM98_12415 [Lewinellaceae bacterium]|nr:hypothetical protein [Lewinellaceae bacterium]
MATTVSSVQSATEAGWRMYPTLLAPGQPLVLECPEVWTGQSATLRVFDAAGRQMWQHVLLLDSRQQTLRMPTDTWPKGTYYLVCSGEPGVFRQTLMVGN